MDCLLTKEKANNVNSQENCSSVGLGLTHRSRPTCTVSISSAEPAAAPTPSAVTQTSKASPSVLLVLGMIIPQVEHEVQTQPHCKASQLYSQHDVVGDPQSCFMSTVDAPYAAGAP
jgi:hypothetical protein